MGSKKRVKKSNTEYTNEMAVEDDTTKIKSKPPKKAKEHVEQLQRLQEKDPEFYQFLKEHDKELLEFDDVDIDEDGETDIEREEDEGTDDMEREEEDEDEEMEEDEEETNDLEHIKKEQNSSKNVITSAMVDTWINSVRESEKISGVRSLMKAFRTACHYGDDGENGEASAKLSIMSSSVFNKIMLFVLSEMDGILRKLLKFPQFGGKKETLTELMSTKQWKNYNHLLKSYLGNALHVLNQMTDTEMISFTLRRLRYSSIFLAGFPALLRKYIKVALHFWGTGGGALPVVSFLFLRDLCIRIGSDCVDDCLKGMYKAYVLNCQFVNATKLQHIQFLGNCVTELLGVDLPASYQHAFVFIRQLAMILREALTMKTKESFRKVYEWKYIHCLELWTGAICAYNSEADFKPLAYPLTQIISGVARLVPTARYLPLRLRCVRMLNRIAASTGTFIPVAVLLLDMLDMKEFNKPPTGGVGKALDLRTVLKVSKQTLKTRSFQEACVYSVVEEVTEHLSQWSYSVAFFELSFVPAVRLRNFCKSTKVERFRREFRQLIRQIEANSEFTNKKRMTISFLPNDPAATSFLEDEKKAGASPLSKYVATLRQRAQQRSDSLMESSLTVGEHSAVFGDKMSDSDEDEDDHTRKEKGAAVFSSSWLPRGESKNKHMKEEEDEEKKKKKKNKRKKNGNETLALDEDVVEDLVLSSDEDDDEDENGDQDSAEEEDNEENVKAEDKGKNKKWNPSSKFSKKKKKPKFNATAKSKKRKRAN